MLGIKDKFPQFNGKVVVTNDIHNAFVDVDSETYKGKWLVMFFWPKDFTFVCPTEIAEFGKLNEQFKDRDAQLIGASTDSEFVHLAWRAQKSELQNLPFPMYSDVKRDLSQALGILDQDEGAAHRARGIFIGNQKVTANVQLAVVFFVKASGLFDVLVHRVFRNGQAVVLFDPAFLFNRG